MHRSSYITMMDFAEKYIFKSLTDNRTIKILDIGSRLVDEQDEIGTYRNIFKKYQNVLYIGCDMEAGKNVDVVLSDPYQWDCIEENSADYVISGQMLEHAEYPWLTLIEINRILKPGGLCCVIAPSAGKIHNFPLDCYRYYPDGMAALAEYADMEVMEVCAEWDAEAYPYLDYMWHDCFLVARKKQPEAQSRASRRNTLPEAVRDHVLRGTYVSRNPQVDSFLWSMNEHIAKLYIDSGNGFSEEEMQFYSFVDMGKKICLTYKFDGPVKKLRFDPCDSACMIGNLKTEPRCAQYDTNAAKILEGPEGEAVYLFDTDDPQIYIDPPGNLLELEISFDFSQINKKMAASILRSRAIGPKRDVGLDEEKPDRPGIDIILPHYNAFEYLQDCVKSVLEHTDLTKDRVILIDNCSTDPRVAPYLRELESKNFLVLVNEENVGFSNSVNRGLQYSDRDVILLNSDTVVTAGWVDKMVRCAYSDDSIGTVTPFSNNATLCSAPLYNTDNPLPEGYSLDQYASLVERYSLREYPELSVAVGFCMFIKRKVIEEVGLLDADTYKVAYGEENDFCWRASELGYSHVLCDDTFIYHKGKVTYTTETRRRLCEEHDRILAERYPQLHQTNLEFANYDFNWRLRANLQLFGKINPNRRNLLFILHIDFKKTAKFRVGGTQFHVQDLVEHLRQTHNVFVMSREEEYLYLTIYTASEETRLKFYVGRVYTFEKPNRRVAKVLRAVLEGFRIDCVHIHHTVSLSLNIFEEISRAEIPAVITLHDYFSICPSVKLLDNEFKFCGGHGDADRCKACLWDKFEISPLVHDTYLQKWREEYKKALLLCQRIIVPSASAKKMILSFYPEIADKLQVCEHGYDLPEAVREVQIPHEDDRVRVKCECRQTENGIAVRGWAYLEGVDATETRTYMGFVGENNEDILIPLGSDFNMESAAIDPRYAYAGFQSEIPCRYIESRTIDVSFAVQYGDKILKCKKTIQLENNTKTQKSRLNIAFIGAQTIEKGSKLTQQLIRNGPQDIHWYVFGGIGDPLLQNLEQRNLTKVGEYEREDLPKLFQAFHIDLICILPIWPETFAYTVSETVMNGIPVIATDIGAVGDRVRQMDCGWLIQTDSSCDEILSLIGGIDRYGEEYLRRKGNAEKQGHKTKEQMAEEYEAIYQSLFRDSNNTDKPVSIQSIHLLTDAYISSLAQAVGADGYVGGSRGDGGDSRIIQDLQLQIEAQNAQLQSIYGSFGYKLLLRFKKIPAPCKKFIKKILRFIHRNFRAG